MNGHVSFRWLAALAACGVWGLGTVAAGQAPEDLGGVPAWGLPDAAKVRTGVMAWLEAEKADPAVVAQVEAIWPADDKPAGGELLERLAQVLAVGDARAAELVKTCSHPVRSGQPPDFPWLSAAETAPLVAANLRLVYGRWLVQNALYDEAGQVLGGLSPDDVVDPPMLLFYQAVVHHQLLQRKEGLVAVKTLLAGEPLCPKRYTAVARLMQHDLEGLKADSLDHIARRMDDVRRRLELGRAGGKVRQVEDGVIESLDKLIKKVQQQQQQQGSAAGTSPRSSSPAQQSRILGGKGPGEVTKRDIGQGSGWGDLPPKQREAALQQIGREFPAHYRDLIEQYFRNLAAQGSPSE